MLKRVGVPLCDGWSGYCFNTGKKQRQNTHYADDKENWVFVCDDCLEYINDYWKERWEDYYGNAL